jgi:hypothetical protein
MKWLIACLLVLCTVVPAVAGEDPFVAVIGNDFGANRFYISPKQQQFLLDTTALGLGIFPETFFTTNTIPVYPEVCDVLGRVIAPGVFETRGDRNYLIAHQDTGRFQWKICLPKKPNAINICIECGVLKPNTFQVFGFEAVEACAANTGELQFPGGFCARDDVEPGENPILSTALPTLEAVASPGPNGDSYAPFHLTAYKNPGTYNGVAQPLANSSSLQLLDGTTASRIMLKSCLDKCVNIKLPVTGQINALGEEETDLEVGDCITFTLRVPRTNTVDIFCGPSSGSIKGIGERLYPFVF